MTLLEKGVRWLRRRRGKLVVFIGNEYDLMAEKIRFLRETRADYVCSQLPIASARWLYAQCEGTEVLAMPHALNPTVYRAAAASPRAIDVGFAGAMYPLFIGDIERTRLIRGVEATGRRRGLRCDIRERTISRLDWARFLRDCEGTVGGESGTYYLDRRGALIAAAKSFTATNPTAPFEQVYERFFARPGVEYVSGKCISSRHFEAIGTRTCQVLLEGDYNGILQGGAHYISVQKDLADLNDAIARFEDRAHRREIADHAYEYVMDEHTHAHRVRALVAAVGG
jgi:hypothetical protein